jgi:hypothetical protein
VGDDRLIEYVDLAAGTTTQRPAHELPAEWREVSLRGGNIPVCRIVCLTRGDNRVLTLYDEAGRALAKINQSRRRSPR